MHGVDFDSRHNIEAGLLEAKAESASACEKVYSDWSHAASDLLAADCKLISMIGQIKSDVDRNSPTSDIEIQVKRQRVFCSFNKISNSGRCTPYVSWRRAAAG
jgi:hypothetical protein